MLIFFFVLGKTCYLPTTFCGKTKKKPKQNKKKQTKKTNYVGTLAPDRNGYKVNTV